MEGVSEQQELVSSFLEIAAGQSPDIARQFLQATNWKLDEAIQLFYVGNEGGSVALPSSPQLEHNIPLNDVSSSGLSRDTADKNVTQGGDDDIRPPLPVKREVLYDHPMVYGGPRIGGAAGEPRLVVPFRNFDEEMKHPGVWEGDQSSSSVAESTRDNLASLYRPPFALMYHGPFEKAKDTAKLQNKWLLLNLQSTKEFSSHMLNRDTWGNEAVAQTIKTNFIFWQVNDDTEEGSKICTYYRIDAAPIILVIDPVTGQKIRSWRGMVQPESLLEDLLPFLDRSPTDHIPVRKHSRVRENAQAPPLPLEEESNYDDKELQQAIAASMAGMNEENVAPEKELTETVPDEEDMAMAKPNYPPLPEEPTSDRNLLCRIGFRLPDGRRLQRNFLRTDPIQLVWSFCYSQLEEAKTRPFRLAQTIPGSKPLDYDSSVTLGESGLANSMISVTWL
ncbi:scaffold/adaptor protein [Lithospermum erythrorhizon]|uniref:Scaffold/adaptor protein n=1 Tax=Lithospermum erythrorhizon TaxID=34254 RepID=A0AAV3Q5R7_LITER